MDRRSALQKVSILLGTTFISTELFITGCKSEKSTALQSESIDFTSSKNMIEFIADTILPSTAKHPGFKAVKEMDTLITILNDCYKNEDKKLVVDGLKSIEAKAQEKFKKTFESLTPEESKVIIAEIDKMYFDKNTTEEIKPKYYGMLKESILLTYFTNETVMTDVFNYTKVPGKYDGAYKIDISKNDTIFGLGV